MRCNYCGLLTHTNVNCPSTGGGQYQRNQMRCTYCGDRKHWQDACPKIVAEHNRKENRYVKD